MERLSEILSRQDPPRTIPRGRPPGDGGRPDRGDSHGGRNCPICGGRGFVYLEAGVDDPSYGRATECACAANETEEERTSRLRRNSNLGPLLKHCFATLHSGGRRDTPESIYWEAILGQAWVYAEGPSGWLVLDGPSGTGKTRLAAAIANRRIDLGYPALFVSVPDLLDHLRSTFAPSASISYDELFEQVRDSEFLVLDDLGEQAATPWANEKLFQLLNHRFHAELATIITLSRPLETVDERLQSRLSGPSSKVLRFRANRDAALEAAGVFSGGTLQKMTFDRFDTTGLDARPDQQETLRSALEQTQAFAQAPSGWLVLAGRIGSGKTHLAASIGYYVQVHGVASPLFIVVPDFLDHLRATFAPSNPTTYDAAFEAARSATLLILDDLGAHSATAWAEEKLFQLLNHRYNAELPTVITTSLDRDQLSLLSPAIASRMGDPRISTVCILHAPDYRTGANDDYESPAHTKPSYKSRGQR
ncbi:MAG: AAA family ATPase [Dehalococcoidia bacterium]|nr:AAA family ATPase [Dehalococcoidia bacterium]